jgi:predicted aspartyl protease
MYYKPFKNIAIVFSLIVAVVFDIKAIHAFTLALNNDRITLHADHAPLTKVLEGIAIQGVAIYIDPEINPKISASLENADIEKGLRSILKSVNHVLIWEPVKGSGETASSKRYKLAEIQIFRQGKKDLMIPFKMESLDSASFQEPGTDAYSNRETAITIKGNLIFVPVTLGYRDKEVETTMLLDTGSNSIVLHQNIADILEIGSYSNSKARGVGGIEIETRITKLDSVKVGPHQKANLTAHVIDYQDEKTEQFNGILGMNFLKNLGYSIDFEQKVIKWLP